MDLLIYWNLNERPFEMTWDTSLYFRSRAHQEAFSRLGFLVSEESMNAGMVTGEIGCGKTLLREAFTEGLDEDHFAVVTLENSCFGFRDLLGAVLLQMGGETESGDQSKMGRYQQFRRRVEALNDQRRHLVIMFDEAQEMDVAAVRDLKLFTNLNGGGRNFLTLILVGQPELRRLLRRVPAVDQRISLRFHLTPLSEAETAEYLEYRLHEAGHPSGRLFTDPAVRMLHEGAGGVPRQINRLAKLALEVGWYQELPVITRGAVEAVVRDLERHQKLCAA